MSKLMLSYILKTNLTEFRSAISNDDTDKICRILDIERDSLNKMIDSEGNTALLLAIQHASPLTVRLLIEQGAHPDQPNTISFLTPLGLLASKVYEDENSYKAKNTLEMAKILLAHGAYVDKPSPHNYRDENNKDYSGKETPLMTAVRKRNLPMVTLFIEKKANVNYVERQSQIRAIHYAITNGDERMFDLLENAGAQCHSIVTMGENTLLHWFCYKKENDKHIFLLEKLIEKGCNINAKNRDQCTPFMLAIKHDMINASRVLLNAQVKTDSQENNVIDPVKSGSESLPLHRQTTNAQRLKSQSQDSSAATGKVLWRKRVNFGGRHVTDLSDFNSEATNSPHTSSKFYDYDDEITIETAPNEPPNHPDHRRDSGEVGKKYERIWEKLVQTRQKRRIARKASQSRSYSVEVGQRSPL